MMITCGAHKPAKVCDSKGDVIAHQCTTCLMVLCWIGDCGACGKPGVRLAVSDVTGAFCNDACQAQADKARKKARAAARKARIASQLAFPFAGVKTK